MTNQLRMKAVLILAMIGGALIGVAGTERVAAKPDATHSETNQKAVDRMSDRDVNASEAAQRPQEAAGASTLLSAVEAGVRLRYFDVSTISSATVSEMRETATENDAEPDGGSTTGTASVPVLFDVREPAEFAVSRIAGAVRVDPEMTADAFLARYGDLIDGRTAVFYCSVGVRSAKMISRLQSAGGAARSAELRNLEGGIFRWHNEKRPLVDADGPTAKVHRFDAYWGRLLARQHLAVGDATRTE